MNAEEIEIQPGGEDERRDPFFPDAALPEFDHLCHRFGRLPGGNSFETNTAAAIGVSLDDVHILLLVEAASQISPRGSLCRFLTVALEGGRLCAGSWST